MQAAYPLRGLGGPQRFTAVASQQKLSRDGLIDGSAIAGRPHSSFAITVGK